MEHQAEAVSQQFGIIHVGSISFWRRLHELVGEDHPSVMLQSRLSR